MDDRVHGVAAPGTAPGAVYHVTARGNERQPIYRDDQDRRRFLAHLAATDADLHRHEGGKPGS